MKTIVLQGSLLLSFALAQLTVTAVADDAATSGRTLIRAGHVLDVRSGSESADQTIIVSGGAITGIAATSANAKKSAGPRN